MNVMQIVRVKLRPEAADVLTASKHQHVLEWLGQWTPQGNFKAVVSGSQDESLEILTDELKKNLVPSWLGVPAHLFTFEVSSQDVENGRFWMSSAVTWCKDHPIPKD